MCQFLSVNERKMSLDTYEYMHHKKQADVIIYNALIRRPIVPILKISCDLFKH